MCIHGKQYGVCCARVWLGRSGWSDTVEWRRQEVDAHGKRIVPQHKKRLFVTFTGGRCCLSYSCQINWQQIHTLIRNVCFFRRVRQLAVSGFAFMRHFYKHLFSGSSGNSVLQQIWRKKVFGLRVETGVAQIQTGS